MEKFTVHDERAFQINHVKTFKIQKKKKKKSIIFNSNANKLVIVCTYYKQSHPEIPLLRGATRSHMQHDHMTSTTCLKTLEESAPPNERRVSDSRKWPFEPCAFYSELRKKKRLQTKERGDW